MMRCGSNDAFLSDLMTSVPSIRAPYSTERKIIRWFGDWPDPNHHYGIHNIIEKHANLFGIDKKDEGKGIWFSPTKISKVLKFVSGLCAPASAQSWAEY
jgi:hypothetical protein